MLATLAERPFSDPAWLFEIKYDGVRVLASRRGDRVELYGRSGQDTTSRYPEVVRALRALPMDSFVIDGEIVALDDAGRPSFQRLQPRMALTDPREIERTADASAPRSACSSTASMLDGRDLRKLPLVERKECLRLLVPSLGAVRYGDHVVEAGGGLLRAGLRAAARGHRGQAGAERVFGRAHARLDQDQVSAPPGVRDRRLHRPAGLARPLRRAAPGRLRRARRSPAPRLRVQGRHRLRRRQARGDHGQAPTARPRHAALRRAAPSPPAAGHHWVEPRLVAEVRFTDWTDDGGLRHPTFIGLRDDKKPSSAGAKSRSSRWSRSRRRTHRTPNRHRRSERGRRNRCQQIAQHDPRVAAGRTKRGWGGLGAERHPLPPNQNKKPR